MARRTDRLSAQDGQPPSAGSPAEDARAEGPGAGAPPEGRRAGAPPEGRGADAPPAGLPAANPAGTPPGIVLPHGSPPWFDLDPETLRFLEIHQTRGVAIPGRAWQDLGDSVMLFAAADPEPFFNRLTAVRWPDDPRRFDERLEEALGLFEALERRPYIWTIPGVTTPADIVTRLQARGFVDLGGGYDMILIRDPFSQPVPALPPGAELHHWHASAEADIAARAEAIASVIGEVFDVPVVRRANLLVEVGLTLTSPVFHGYVLTIDGVPVATGQRYTFDGASYLSSIGTLPRWRGRGLGEIVTRVLARDSVEEGCRLVYLGVHAGNESALRLYERVGFALLGGRSADLLRK